MRDIFIEEMLKLVIDADLAMQSMFKAYAFIDEVDKKWHVLQNSKNGLINISAIRRDYENLNYAMIISFNIEEDN